MNIHKIKTSQPENLKEFTKLRFPIYTLNQLSLMFYKYSRAVYVIHMKSI